MGIREMSIGIGQTLDACEPLNASTEPMLHGTRMVVSIPGWTLRPSESPPLAIGATSVAQTPRFLTAA